MSHCQPSHHPASHIPATCRFCHRIITVANMLDDCPKSRNTLSTHELFECGSSHHTGCACHEARRDAEIDDWRRVTGFDDPEALALYLGRLTVHEAADVYARTMDLASARFDAVREEAEAAVRDRPGGGQAVGERIIDILEAKP